MKKRAAMLLILTMAAMLFTGCTQPTAAVSTPNETDMFIFVDSCGREVVLPETITRVAPSGSVAQMILYTIAPEKLIGWSSNGKDTLNLEALIAAKPDVIIDLGDKKATHAEDMNKVQEQTGIPTIFIEANMDTFAAAYRTLGMLLGTEQQAEACAQYIEQTVAAVEEAAEKIPEAERLSVMFGTGKTGRDCNARGSIHADVIELVGAVNAIKVAELSSKGGGNTISMEELLRFDPQVILLAPDGPYLTVGSDPGWAGLAAIKNNRYYEIPSGPYNFLSNPPSVNRIIGIKWLGNLLYPKLYPFDMISEVKTFYKLFWHFDLSDDAAKSLLANSTFKTAEAD
jgi:iron complex transport system substrate-binding protein